MRRRVVVALAGVAAIIAAGLGSVLLANAKVAWPVAPMGVRATNLRVVAGSGGATDWPTYHRGSARDGVDPAGPALGQVRRLWTAAVDGAVYAEPLVVAGRVIVATENDSVYAFDAGSGRLAWRIHLGTPVAGGDLPCGDIDPSGITGTPVVDPKAGIVYAVTFERGPQHVLVAVDLASGRVRWQRPIDPPGADPTVHQQRAALALSRGRVYVAYGGLYGDCGDYHGWVVAIPTSGPSGSLVSYRVPTGREGGIWAPSGPAVDAAGNLYVATGNGSSSSFDYGNAVIRLSAGLQATGFFAPHNAGALNGSDADLGSTGPLLLPGSRAFIIGKSGIGYLLNADQLGGIGHPLATLDICGAAFGGLAYGQSRIYIPCTSGIVALHLTGSSLREVWHQPAATSPPIVAGRAVWAIGGRSLYQLDSRTGAVRYRASIGNTAHFATPAASGGRIFVAAGERLLAFG